MGNTELFRGKEIRTLLRDFSVNISGSSVLIDKELAVRIVSDKNTQIEV